MVDGQSRTGALNLVMVRGGYVGSGRDKVGDGVEQVGNGEDASSGSWRELEGRAGRGRREARNERDGRGRRHFEDQQEGISI